MSNKSSAHSKTDRTRKRKRPDPDGRAPPLRGREEILPETNSSGRQDRESNTTTKTVQLKSANEGSKRRWKVTELLAEADSTVALEDGEEDHTPLPENKRRKRAVLWRDEEIKKLHDAFTNFVKTQGYTENEIIQYVFSKEHKKNSEARKVRSKLSAALADAVQERGKASVWARFLRCYHPHRAMGTWTEEEDQILLEMSELEGVTNRMIGEEIGRSFYDVIDRLKVLRSGKAPPHKLIKWTEAETQRLIEGIKKVTTQYGYGPYDSELEFGWSLVAAYVGTRSIPKCITTWKKLVEKGKVKQPASYNRSETRRQVDDIFFSEDQFREFIKRLRESKVERLADIDWHDFLSGGWCPLDFNQCRQWMRLNFHGRLRWKLILLSLEEVLQALEDKRAAGLLRFTGSRSRAKRTGAAGPRSSVLRIVARTSGNKPNPWTQEETQRLIEAVTDLYWEKNKQPPNTQQAWEAIARQVPTQSNSRCRQRWYSWLYDVFHPDVGKVTWEFKDEAELIDRIRNSGAIESNSIDWQAVAGTDWTWHTPDICRVHWERRVLMHPIASAFDVEKQLDWLSDQILEQKSASKTPHDWFKHYYYGMDTEEVNKVREAVFKEIIQRNKDVHEATPEQWAQVSRRCKSFPNICRVLWDAWVHCRYIDADGVRYSWTPHMQWVLCRLIRAQGAADDTQISWERVEAVKEFPYSVDQIRSHWERLMASVPTLAGASLDVRVRWLRERLIQCVGSREPWSRDAAAMLMAEVTRRYLSKGRVPSLSKPDKWDKVAAGIQNNKTPLDCLLKWREWTRQPVFRSGRMVSWNARMDLELCRRIAKALPKGKDLTANSVSWKDVVDGEWCPYTAMEVREHWHLKVALAPYIPSREDPNRLVPVASLKFVKQVKHFKHQAKEAAKVAVDGDDRADDKLMDALGATDLADMNDMDENDIRDELGYTIDGLPSPPMMTTKQGNPKYKPSTKHAKATRGNKRAVLKASSKRHMGMSKSGGGSHRRHH